MEQTAHLQTASLHPGGCGPDTNRSAGLHSIVGNLFDSGALTQQEFEPEKTKVLNAAVTPNPACQTLGVILRE